MNPDIKDHIKARETWLCGFFMLLFVVIFNVAEILLLAVAGFQFLCVLFTGQANSRLVDFGSSLSRFVFEVARFLSYNTEDKPFPFKDWPASQPAGQAQA